MKKLIVAAAAVLMATVFSGNAFAVTGSEAKGLQAASSGIVQVSYRHCSRHYHRHYHACGTCCRPVYYYDGCGTCCWGSRGFFGLGVGFF